jgi:hypothetical protein
MFIFFFLTFLSSSALYRSLGVSMAVPPTFVRMSPRFTWPVKRSRVVPLRPALLV